MAHFNPQVRAFGAFLLCCILGLGQAHEAGYEDWSVEDTQSWLRKIGLDRELGPGFELHEYDGRALQVLETRDILERAEFPLTTEVHFKILQKELARLAPTSRPTGNSQSATRARRLEDEHKIANKVAVEHMSQLRTDRLKDYDPHTAPITFDKYGNVVPVKVTVGLRFYAIRKVDVPNSELELLVWVRQGWKDRRLAWNPADYGGINQTSYHARMSDAMEDGDIWMPDLELYNTPGSLHALSNKPVMLWPDGSAFLSRSGIITIMCSFAGVENFPYDTLSCSFDMGGWGQSGLFVDFDLMGTGYDFHQTDEADLDRGEQNRHYTFGRTKNVTVSRTEFFYPCCLKEPWPTITYTVYVARRATSFFFRFLVFPQTLLTYLSMAVFFLDVQIGERLGFGVTIVLVLGVSEVVVAPYVPVCNAWIWSSKYGFACMIYSVLSLLESCLVLYVYYDMEGFSIFNAGNWLTMNPAEAAQTWSGCFDRARRMQRKAKNAKTLDPSIASSLEEASVPPAPEEPVSPLSVGHNQYLLNRGIQPKAIQRAKQIDAVCRVLFPVTFTTLILYLFSLVPTQSD